MSSAEFESIQPSWDQHELEQGVHRLGLLYGISGLEVVVAPGEGTGCAKLDRGLRVTIDPKQVLEGNGHGMTSPEHGSTSPEINALFMTAHELGHAKDYLDPAWRPPVTNNKSRAFFDCLIDDTVIDKRSRRVPLFDANADAVYAHQIPSDLRELPKHVQLMYGIRINKVVRNQQLEMDPVVQDILTDLSSYEKDTNVFDIPAVLADPRTSLTERRRIADTFILPHYEALLGEDKQEQQSGQGEPSQAGDGDFETIYDQYEQTVHGHRHEDSDSDSQSGQQGQGECSGQSSDSHDLADQMVEALKQAAKELKAENAAKAKARASSGEADPSGDQQREAGLAELAGTVAAEMSLSQGDAESYVHSLDTWTPTIKEVADVFMKLAAPANVIKSPRYIRGAHTEGIRLHPRTMASVALQLATDQEQAIWQPIEQKAHRQEVTFGGLDVHLLVDVSGSMAGVKAQCAADTALCLIEGLQLARHKVSRKAGQAHQPDVRTQIIAFGSGTEVLSPLSYAPTGQQKGKTYVNLLQPDSSSTLVNGALENVKQAASIKPKRDVIAIIVSDGHFGDHDLAAKSVANMPKSAYVAHLVIGSGAQEFISDNHEVIGNPSALPGKLHGVLAEYIRRSQ